MKTLYAKGDSRTTRQIEDSTEYSADYWTETAPPDSGRYFFRNGEWNAWGSMVFPVRYSKRKIIRKLKDVGLWDSIKADLVSADAWDEFDAATWLASDDTLFVSMKAQLAESYPNVNLEELLEQCKY